MIDIDFFKNYNDLNGHQAGDYLLKELSSIFKANLRDSDVVGRYGGEEFIIILPEVGNTRAIEICERIRKYVEDYNFKFKESQPEKKVTISIGLMTTTNKNNNDVEEVIGEVDRNLYKSKNAGRNKLTNSIIE